MPCSLALIAHTYTEPQARRRALAVWGAVSGVGLASGPVVGGILVASVGWRAIFLANVPVGLAAAWLLVLYADETPRRRRPLDLPGQVSRDVQPRRPHRRLHQRRWARLGVGADARARSSPEAWPLAAFVLLERDGAPTTDRPGDLPEHDLHDGGRDRLPVQLLSLRKHLLPGRRPGAAARLGRAGDGLRPASDDSRRGSDGASLRDDSFLAWASGGSSSQGSHAERPGQRSSPLNGSAANLGLLLVSTVPIGFTALAMPAMTGLAMASAPRLGLGLSAGVFNTSRQAGRCVGRGGARQRSHRRWIRLVASRVPARGLRVRTGSRTRRRCSRAYAGFGSGRRPVSVYGSRRAQGRAARGHADRRLHARACGGRGQGALLEFIGKGTSLDEAATPTSLAGA